MARAPSFLPPGVPLRLDQPGQADRRFLPLPKPPLKERRIKFP